MNQVRDSRIACLSDRLELVHANTGGNMEHNARLALRAGRQVHVALTCSCAAALMAEGATELVLSVD